jgi:hypothetical protein
MKPTLLLLLTPIACLASGGFYYKPPPPLSAYHERIPTKTALSTLDEAMPRSADALTLEQLETLVHELADVLQKPPLDRFRLKQRLDVALKTNRLGEYQMRFANYLWDLRDLLETSAATDDEVGAYAQWRLLVMDRDTGRGAKEPLKNWAQTEAQYAAILANHRQSQQLLITDLKELIAKASPALKPHYQVQWGAQLLRGRKAAEARDVFQQVIDAAPLSGRAEVAMLMMARCELALWEPSAEGQPFINKDSAPWVGFERYLTRYPNGRYAADVPGWLAGIAQRQGHWYEFIRLTAQQMKQTNHPEVMRRAAAEFDLAFAKLAREQRLDLQNHTGHWDDPSVWELLAAEPVLATRVLYFFLDAQASIDGQGRADYYSDSQGDREMVSQFQLPVVQMREQGREALPQLVQAITEHRAKHGSDSWSARHLLVLAWAATQSGMHQHAAVLIAGHQGVTDDLLFAKTVIFARAGKTKEAKAAGYLLLAQHGKSVFAAETRYRLAGMLKDSGDWAGALLSLHQVAVEGARSSFEILEKQRMGLRLRTELEGWVHAVMQFGDLDQLMGLTLHGDTPPELWKSLAPIVRRRLCAMQRFEDSLKVANFPRVDAEAPWDQRIGYLWGQLPELSQAEWNEVLQRMIELRQQIADSQELEVKAHKMMELAAVWQEQRGRMIMPLRTEQVRLDPLLMGSLQLANAEFLGISASQAGENMDRRDELWHSLQLWCAVGQMKVPQAKTALEMANEALRQLAEVDDTAFQRAFENNATQLSQKLCLQLSRDFPNSPEALRAINWTFPAFRTVERLPNNCYRHLHEDAIVEAITQKPAQPQLPGHGAASATITEIRAKAENLLATVEEGELADIAAELLVLRVEAVKHPVDLPTYSALLNDLDDLSLAASKPGTNAAWFGSYAKMRLDHSWVPEDPSDPQSVGAAFQAFLHRIRAPSAKDTANRAGDIAQRMEDYLVLYPDSPKKEAARTRLIVNRVRASLEQCEIQNVEWPAAPWVGRYVHPLLKQGSPLHAASVLTMIRDYEADYPEGAYLAEVRSAKALVLLSEHRYADALPLLVSIVEDPAKHDLHHAACLRLAFAFMKLLEPENRISVLAALQATPSCHCYLKRFIHSHSCGGRLALLEPWLGSALRWEP